MKRCPTCKRTYASDEFTFCLDDGALLSPPYEQKSDKSTDKVRRPTPPTEVLAAAQRPTVSSPRDDGRATPALPTLTAPEPRAIPAPRQAPPASTRPAAKTAVRIIYLAASLVLFMALIFGGLFIYESRCPALIVTCSPGDNLVGCVVGGDSSFHLIVSRSVTWRVSSGSLRRADANGAVFDTTGFAGKQITVMATYQSWWCSTSATKSFVAE